MHRTCILSTNVYMYCILQIIQVNTLTALLVQVPMSSMANERDYLAS